MLYDAVKLGKNPALPGPKKLQFSPYLYYNLTVNTTVWENPKQSYFRLATLLEGVNNEFFKVLIKNYFSFSLPV